MYRHCTPWNSMPAVRLALALMIIVGSLSSASAEEHCAESADFSVCWASEDARERVGDLAWLASGSTGVVDETSRHNYAFRGTDAYVKHGRNGTVILRYQPSLEAYRTGVGGLAVRYKDDGPNARVRVKLIASTLTTPEPINTVIFEFDSDDRPSKSGIQTYVTDIAPGQHFGESVYHIEVRITRDLGGDPRLAAISLLQPSSEEIEPILR